MSLGHPLLRMYFWLEFIYLVFTRMPGGITVSDSGLCCCVPCLSGAINSLCLLSLTSDTKQMTVKLSNET